MRSRAVLLLFLTLRATAQSLHPGDLNVLAGTPLAQQYDEMLQKFLIQEAKSLSSSSLARMEKIHNEGELRSWQEEARGHFLEAIGGLPSPKTPLNARVTGEVKREGYVIRKIVFESRPEFYVTANLYVPNGQGPFPGVLAPNGHSVNGKAYVEYQRLYVGLVRRGYVVLTWDNVGQGERFQYWDYVFHQRGLVTKSNEHGLLGTRQIVLDREPVWNERLVWLMEGSPAINSGIDAAISTDLDGNNRTNIPDIGAYETTF